jgi:hypothetical protein
MTASTSLHFLPSRLVRIAAVAAVVMSASAPSAPAQQPSPGSGVYMTRGATLRVDRDDSGFRVTLVRVRGVRCFRAGDVVYRLRGDGPTYHGTSLLRYRRSCQKSPRRGSVTARLAPGKTSWVLRVHSGHGVLVAIGPRL